MISASKRSPLSDLGDARPLYDMLEGCLDGATEGALAQHGFTRDQLDSLVARGFLTVETQQYTHGQTVQRFRVKRER